MACQIDRRFTKDQTVDLLIQMSFYGRGARGPDAAAQAWFGKPLDRLTIAENALLAGRLKSPGNKSPARLVQRRGRVLDAMRDAGAITQDQHATAVRELVIVAEDARALPPPEN